MAVEYLDAKEIDEVRAIPNAYLVMEGDSGGQTYLTCPVAKICCSDSALRQLLDDLNHCAWADGERLYYMQISDRTAWSEFSDNLWLHRRFAEAGLYPAVLAVIEGRATDVIEATDPAMRYETGETFFHWLLDEPASEDLALRCLHKGAEPLAADLHSATPLHKAAGEGWVQLLRELLERGAPVDCLDSFGQTPLHWATRSAECEAARILLAAGANLLHLSSLGTARDHAYRATGGLDPIVRFIEEEYRRRGLPLEPRCQNDPDELLTED